MLAGSVGSVSFTNTQALTIGTVQGVSGLAATGSLVVDLTSGDLSVASGATVTGASPLLVTTTAFVNSQGSNAVTASSGSWQIFSANPTGDTFGSLNSNNVAVWNTTYSGSANAATGNRYIFSFRPTVTFTPQSISKTYGVNDTAAVSSSYIVTGVQGAVTNAFLGDTAASAYSGSPSVTSTGSAATAGVGSYSVIATVGSLSAKDNYALGYGSAATLTVNTATLTVTANALSRAYGAANPTLTYSTSGLVNGDTLSGALATSAVATSGVGAYAITAGTLANANYAISYTGANLTVTQAPLTVTANAQSRAYGAANPTLTYTAPGLLNGDTLSGALASSAVATSGVGSYTITQGSLANANYAISYTGANLTVTQAPLTVTANAQSRAYGAANPTLTYTAAGLLNGDTLSGALASSAVATSGVGAYAITQGSLANANYVISYTGANLTVTQAPLTVTADAQSRSYGAANPTLTYSTSGLVNGDTLSGALATSAVATSGVGAYAITQGTLAASANYAISYTGANLTVTQAPLTVTADAQSRAYGAANPTLTYTAPGLLNGDTLSGALTSSAAATSGVGAYAITQGSLANANYVISYTGANLTVTQAPLTVTADAQSRAYGAANPTLTYSTSGLLNGDTLSGALATSAVATSGVGSYTITQGSLANANYAISYTGANLTVTQAPLTVTADAQSRSYGAANPTLTYTAPGLLNGDTLSGALATSAVATSNVGAYAITRGSLANANYAISYTGANLTITQAPLTVTADAQSRSYGAANPTLTYTAPGLLNGDSLTGALATSAVATSNVGAYAITRGSLANANYAISYTGANLTVTQAPLTVTADAQSRAYGAANPTLTYTAPGLLNGDTLSGALATSAVATSNVGAYAITQGSLANANYAISYTGANLTITQAPLTVTADAQSRAYGAANPTLTYTAPGLLNGDTLSGALATSAVVTSSVGAYAITVGTLANANYAISYTGANLTVTQAPLTVTADAKSRAYGAANPTLTYTAPGLLNGDSLTGALASSAVATSGVGAYAITQGSLANANYAISYTGANLTITQAPLTVTADAQSRAYGAANPTLTYTAPGLLNGDTLSGALATSAVATSNVGAYAITQGSLANANYAISYTGANLTVTQAPLTVTADAQSRAYGAANPTLTYTAPGLLNGDTLSGALTSSAAATSGVGAYAITQGSLANANYVISYTGANLTVTQAPLTVTADAQSRSYGAANPTLTYSTSGLVNGDSLTGALATSAVATTNVGAYAITVGTLANANYAISYTGANLTVTQAPLTVTANAQSRAYGAANPTLTYSTSGLVNGDTLSGALATSAVATSGVGAYAITQGTLAASANYAISYTGANLTVTQAPLTVTADAQSRSYGAANPTLTYTAPGLLNGDTLSGALATSAVATSGVGAYAITQGSLANANYAISYTGANLTVTQAPLTVTADAKSRAYGAANPTLTYTAAGLLNGDTLSGALATSAVATSGVGAYAITQGSLANVNYAISYTGANLTVTQAPLTVTADAQSRSYGAANPTLTYTAAGLLNGDSLTGALATSAVATSGVGAYAITVGTLANANYVISYTGANLTVTQAPLTVTANAQSRAYGAANPTLTYTAPGLLNGDTLSGALATSAVATSNVGAYAITQGSLANANYAISYTGANLTVTQAPLTVTADAQSRSYGAANPTLTYTAPGLLNGDTLSGALATSAVATSNAGAYAITQGSLANANYVISYTGANLTITQAPLTVTANAQSRAYGAANPTLTYTAPGLLNGDSLTGALATSAVATSNVGAYAITQGSLANANYAISYTGANLTVTQAPLTVTADAQSRSYGAANPTLTYTAPGLLNGDTLSGALATSAVATSNAGAYAITQGSLANANYVISYTGANLTITQAPLTVTANAQSRAYGAANPTLTYTAPGLLNGDSLTGALATSAVVTSGVGAYAITQGSLANANYAISYTNANLTVTQAPLTVTADAQSRSYGAANPTLTYSTSGLVNGDTLSGALATSAVATSGVGAYAITQGTLAASANYAISYTGANLTVTQAPLTVTADAQSRSYGAANPTLTYTAPGLLNGDSLTGALATSAVATSGVGAYAITQGSLANANYVISYTGANLTVTQAPLTVTADAQSRAYGAANPTLTYSTSGLVNGDSLTGALASSAVATSGVGAYAITQGTLAASANYVISYTGANLTITQAPLTVTANAQSRAYGAANPTLTYTAPGLLNGDSLTGALATSAVVTSGVGAYAITQGSLANANYAISYTGANLTVTQAPLTVTADAQSRSYGAANPTLTYTAPGLLNGDTLSGALATSAVATSNVGAYAITQGSLANANYAISYTGANLTVTQAPLTVTADAQSRAYGAANPTLTYSTSGLVNGDSLTGALATSAVATSGVGAYAITQGSLANANYAISYTGANLTVTQAPLTVTADAQSRAYGAANPTLTYTAPGLLNGDTLSGALATSAVATSNVGAYAITQGSLANANYAISYTGANLTVTQAPLTVTADAQSRSYGAANPTLTYTAPGLLNGDTLSGALATSAVATSNAGAYAITQGSLANANYVISYTGANLTITQAPLTVTANAQSRAYGAANPTLTYTAPGLLNGDSLTGALATSAVVTSGVGAYAITQGSLANANYAISYTGANLTVTQAPLTVTADAQSRSYGAANPTLTYSTSGLVNGDTLSGALATSAVATSGVGAYAITQGTLAASANYAISYTGANLTVTQAPLTVTADAQSRSYGAANPTLTYTAPGLLNGDSLTGALATSAVATSGVGAYAITQGSLANANYVISYTGANLTVTQAPLTVTADAQSRAYGAANPTLTYSTSGLVNGDSLTGALASSAVATSGVGAYAITQGTLAASANYVISYTGANLTITQAPLTVTANAQSRAYGAANPMLTYTAPGLLNGDTLSGALATSAVATSGVGAYAISQGSLANANYVISYTGANLTVTQAPLTVTADAQSRAYGAANPTLTYTAPGLLNGDSLTGALATSAAATSGVGAYAITQGTLAASANYALSYTGANLTVTQAPLTVTANARSRAYGAANPTLTYSTSGLVNGDTLSGALATSAVATSGVGAYAITQGTLAASANYAISYTGANLTVTQAPLTVTADAQSRAYGAANPTLTYTAPGLLNGDSLTGALATSAVATSGVGAYAITVGTLANANYAISYTGANLTVTQAPLTVTADAQSRAYGAANPTLTYTAPGLLNGDSLTGALATSAAATSGVGAYAITQGTLAASANYALSYTGANLTVTQAPLTVTANAQSRAYGAANPTLTYSTSGLVNGDTLSGALATSAVATSGVGAYAITQGSLANANYAISYTGANLTITQAPLTVTADAQSRAYGAANPTLTYTAPGLLNGDSLTGALATSAVATSGVGAYAITQGSLANANYAISYTGANLTVTQAPLTVTADAQSRAYGAANPTLTYTAAGLLNGDTLSGALATSAVATSGVGAYAITQGSLANVNYAISYTGANLTVTQAPLTVTADAQSRSYGAANPTLTYTAPGLLNGDTLSGALATSAVATSGVGAYAITVGTLANANYAISYTGANLTVTQAPLTVTADAQSRSYGAANPTLTYTAAGLLNGDTLSGALATSAVATSGVGAYAISQGSLANANYVISYTGANLTVTQAPLTVTADAQSRAYGAANPTLTYTAPGLLNGDSLTGALATSAVATSNVGAYAITVGTLANANYAISYTGANLTVTQAPLTVTADAQSRSYGAANPTLTYTAPGLLNGDTLSGALATSAVATSGVGAYAITVGTLANANYAISYTGANLTVTQAPLTVTADAQSRSYGAANPTLTYTAAGLLNGDTLSGALATSAVATSGVGAYAITQGTLAASANYAISYTGANLTVTQAPLTVTADAQSRAYGAANPTLTYTAPGLLNGDTLSGALATSAVATSNVGAYAITQGSLANANYAISYTGANLTVTQAPLTVTADAQSRSYGAANPTLTYTAPGLLNGDTLSGTLATSAVATSGVGAYAITVGTLANANYAISYTGANLTVTQAPLTVTADAQSRSYGAANPTLTYTAPGLLNGDTLSGALATSAVATSGVGAYAITVGTLANANYAISYTGANLTVTQAPLTVTADAQSRSYGAANPTLTYTAPGLLNGDSLTGALATSAVATSNVGAYAITVGTLANANYAISYTGANLTVTQAPLTVTADAQSRSYGAANPTLTYTAPGLLNGDTLAGALATSAVATSNVGAYAITVGTLANANYAISYTGANLTVTQAPLTVTADAKSRPYGAANPTLTYSTSGLVNGDTLSGALATSAVATSNVGAYAITQGTLAASANYALSYTGANLTVTQAPLTVTADAQSRAYGAANPTLTYTAPGLLNGDTLSGALATSAVATSNVGAYAITQGSLANANYAISYTGASLTITAAPAMTARAPLTARLAQDDGIISATLISAAIHPVTAATMTTAAVTHAASIGGATNTALATTVLMNEGTARAAASRDSDDVLAIMLRTSWGHTAAEDASDLGVNPYAVAATCVLATGCSTPTEGAASQGVFQLNPAYFQQGLQTALTVAPALASQIVQGSDDTHDPTTEAIAAAGYLILVDRTLKNAGILDPTILQARGFFIFGMPSLALATAPPGATMAAAMPDVPQATLTANGITPGETVAQWEAFLTARIGPAATQRLLIR